MIKQMKYGLMLAGGLLLSLSACKSPSTATTTGPASQTGSAPSSTAAGDQGSNQMASNGSIEQRVEAAGAGDMAQVSEPQMEQWMQQHKDVAHQTHMDCQPKMASATAAWNDTTEGRICKAAGAAANGSPMGPMGDHGPGKMGNGSSGGMGSGGMGSSDH